MMNGREKSDSAILAMKPANYTGEPAAEQVERRAGTKGNTDQSNTCRAQNRASVPQGLERVRQSARQRKKERFTTLLHHVSIDRLRESCHARKRNAAPGVDGMTWRYFEAKLEDNLQRLHAQVQSGAYRCIGSVIAVATLQKLVGCKLRCANSFYPLVDDAISGFNVDHWESIFCVALRGRLH